MVIFYISASQKFNCEIYRKLDQQNVKSYILILHLKSYKTDKKPNDNLIRNQLEPQSNKKFIK